MGRLILIMIDGTGADHFRALQVPIQPRHAVPARADDDLCVFAGPDIPQRIAPAGGAMQMAPTPAKIPGIAGPGNAPPLF